ncbi:MAG: DUF2142 domain-containing protein [Caldilineaceae bacterium]|nr:DUF2142 domain-containing protein [Caldilineaceae bacterium]
MTSPKPVQKRPLLVAVLLIYGVLGVWYSLVVPPFETPDEPFHYAFARHLAQGNGLPVQRPDEEGPWAQEGSQAPLYYMLTGLLTSAIDQSDYAALATRNPRANIGDPLYPGNKNFMLYSGASHAMRGANLALHVGRWFSLLLGGLTVYFTWATARLALPNRPELAAVSALFAALIPQFLFLSASFSNDNLIIAASAATLYWLARLLVQSRTRTIRASEWLVLGCLLGMAALSKLHGLGLFGLAALCGLWITWRRRDWLLPLRALAPVAVPALIIAGWWYWRNYTLYGDWLGIQHLLEINGQRAKSLNWSGLWGELRGLRYSFWGLFGWFNIPLPTWVYAVFDGMVVLGIVGQVSQLAPILNKVRDGSLDNHWASWETRSTYSGAVLGLLAAWIVLSLGLLAYWIMQATGSQGRLLFPALSALVILLVWGLDGWLQMLMRWSRLRWQWRRLPQIYWSSLAAFMVGCSLYVLLFLVPAAYDVPKPVARVSDSAQLVDVTYGDAARGQDLLRLLALAVGHGHYGPGDAVPVTLYLTADAPVREDYQLFIQFLDAAGEPLANLTSHPGWGRNPTSLWIPGAIYADAYQVRIDKPIAPDAPLLARVYTGFITPNPTDEDDLRPMMARNAAGDEITPYLASVAIRPWRGPDLAALRGEAEKAGQLWLATQVQFGEAIVLKAFALPTAMTHGAPTLPVTLVWAATGQPSADYTAYVHLLNADGEQVAGFDQPPLGQFPTSYWQAPDEIVSRFMLPLPPDLPPGRYAAWLGMYESASQGAVRLPVEAATGLTVTNDELLLGQVVIK